MFNVHKALRSGGTLATKPSTKVSSSDTKIDNDYEDDDMVTHKNGAITSIRSPNLSLHWKVPLTSVSGLSVSGLSMSGESYRPYKGVRNITKSGLYQVRYS